jgi:branched-chain amino acid transport system substrate-binding protein
MSTVGTRTWALVAAATITALTVGCGSSADPDGIRLAARYNLPVGARTGAPSPAGDGLTSSDATATPPAAAGTEDAASALDSAAPAVAPQVPASPARSSSSASRGGTSEVAPTSGSASAPTNGRLSPVKPSGAGEAGPVAPDVPSPAGNPASSPKADIVVGSIGIESGPLGAAHAPSLNGLKAWVGHVNATGGVGGHRVRLVDVNDGGDSNRALSAAKQLVEQEGAIVLLGVRMVTTLPAIIPYVEAKKVPVLGEATSNPASDSSPMVFTPQFSAVEGTGWAHIAWARQTRYSKVAFLYCSEVISCKTTKDAAKRMASQVGLQPVYEAQVSIAQPDYTAEVLAARNAGADVIVSHTDAATVIRVARSAHRQGYFPGIAGNHTVHSETTLKSGGADLEGALASSPTAEWQNSPLMAEFREAMDRYVPGGEKGATGTIVWAAGKLLEKIGQAFPAKATAADVLAGLYGLRGETLGGIVPPLTFPTGRHDQVNQCAVPVTVKGGKFVALGGTEHFECAPGWNGPR